MSAPDGTAPVPPRRQTAKHAAPSTSPSAPQRGTALRRLYDEQGQSPWLDDLRRSYLLGDEMRRRVTQGIRGVTSNPTIFQRAIAGSTDYDTQFAALTRAGRDVQTAY